MKITRISMLFAIAIPGSLTAGVQSTAAPSPIQSTAEGDWACGLGAGFQLGTQGAGLHLTYSLNENFYLSLEGNYMEYNHTFNIDDVDYDGELNMSNLGLTGNYLPFGSGFRVTGGVFFGQNDLNGTASGAGQVVEVNDINYTLGAGDSLHGSAGWNNCTPYLGVGWDWALGAEQNFILGLDLGVLYMGSADATLTGTGIFAAGGSAAADLQAEADTFENDVEDYKFYPVLKLSLTYRF